MTFPDGIVVKNLPANSGDSRDTDSIHRSGRSPGVENGNLLQYSPDLWIEPVGDSLCGHKWSDLSEHTGTHTYILQSHWTSTAKYKFIDKLIKLLRT